MSTELTTYVGLRIDTNLTANSKYNLRLIDQAFSFVRLGRDGSRTLTASNGIVILPKGDLAGGTVTVADPERPAEAVNIWAPVQMTSLTLKATSTGKFFRILPNPAAEADITLTAPATTYEVGDLLRVTEDGVLEFVSLAELGIITGGDGEFVLKDELGEEVTIIVEDLLETIAYEGAKAVNFLLSAWTGPTNDKYTLSIPETTHGLGANVSVVSIMKTEGGGHRTVLCDWTKDGSGNVNIIVDGEFNDNRFAGRAIIQKGE